MTATAARVKKTPKKFETKNFYNYKNVLSRNAVYNFIVGARGLGKTWGAKHWAIRDAINNGNQFIYLRRYGTEMKTLATWFADIAQEFPEYEFQVVGKYAQMCERKPDTDSKKRKWVTIGFFIALSKAQQEKSVAYPLVTKIIFDEFIIEKGAVHYLPDEAKAFNDFYATVDRWRDKTRVLFLANSVLIHNPYFIEYDIRPDDREFIMSHGGFVCAHFPSGEGFQDDVFKTRFGQFIQGTDYAGYAVGNKFRDNGVAMIGAKTADAAYAFTLECKTGIFSVWVDTNTHTYYVQEKRPRNENLWTMLPDRMTEDKILVTYSDKTLQYVRSAYGRGKVLFSSPQARNAFIGVFNR